MQGLGSEPAERRSAQLLSAVLLAVASLSIAACGGDNDDLDQYINEVKSRPGGRIDPLPEIKPYEGFTYVADAEGIRSPFIPDTPQVSASGVDGGVGPDPERSKEFLEGFPLDTLSMVGTLYIGETMYGLVQTSDGLIHRVIPGRILGGGRALNQRMEPKKDALQHPA